MSSLPCSIQHVGVPPIKCQGIKTKLVPFILRSVCWTPACHARWIEPFLGSGVVAFNLAPAHALLADANPHIIRLYQAIQAGQVTGSNLRAFLTKEGKRLADTGDAYYYEIRERFNAEGSPFDFLFLNRSCFNGVMRFNSHGKFNVPFGHKPARFTLAYITKIVNQVNWVAHQMQDKVWEFRVARWEDVLLEARAADFVYLDPPYIGRHTDYYNAWDEAQAVHLATTARNLPCGFALSMWLENRHRKNAHIDQYWAGLDLRVCSHFYYVGSTEDYRNQMDEALVVKPGFATPDEGKQHTKKVKAEMQLSLPLEYVAG